MLCVLTEDADMADIADLRMEEVDILRRLAEEKAEAAGSSANRERRDAWYCHDAGPGGRPMILAHIGGICDEYAPVPESSLQCGTDWAKKLERQLKIELYQFHNLRDDHVIEPWMNVRWQTHVGDFGVKAVVYYGDHDGKMGARRWDPPITDLDNDFEKLHHRRLSVDRNATLSELERMEKIFSDILPVRIRGGHYWSMGLTWRAIDLIGLEGLMLSMCDNPQGLHRLMAFLRDDHLLLAAWLEQEGLNTLNNENDPVGGGLGYTKDLPGEILSDERVMSGNLWVLSESQETVGVGPQMFEEFVFPYQMTIIEKFGKCYYGCCEPLKNRWPILKRIRNLDRVSVCPWEDEEYMAKELGTDYVYSRKPSPSLISTGKFDDDLIRKDIRRTMSIAKGLRIELIMKDVHTLNNEPTRISRWVEIAREETEKSY